MMDIFFVDGAKVRFLGEIKKEEQQVVAPPTGCVYRDIRICSINSRARGLVRLRPYHRLVRRMVGLRRLP